MSVNIPVVNAPDLYVDNLLMAWATTKTITVQSGAARDSTNTNDIVLSAGVTINAAANGKINRLDTGTLAASTRYYVFAVGDSTRNQVSGALMSTSLTAPVLPFGYDMFRYIGYVFTDVSSNLLLFWQSGIRNVRTTFMDVGISELAAGAATTFTEIDLATSLPARPCTANFIATYTPNGATDNAEFLPFGSAASNGIVRLGTGVAGAQTANINLPVRIDAGVPKVLYKVTSGDTLTLLCVGCTESL